jgi:integrase
MPGFHRGRPPRNKGRRYPPDPPPVEEIIAVMRAAGDGIEGLRLRALIVILWRAGLRISEALSLAESDLDPVRGAILVRAGKGGRRREIGMDRWGWEQLQPWLEARTVMPVGALLCVIHRPTTGRPWTASSAVKSSGQQRYGLVFVGGSLPISSGMRTRSRCRARGCLL